jgi:FkbM family methyltransferase
MRIERGWAYPDADHFMAAEMHDDGSYQGSHLAMALAHVTDWSCAVDGGAHVGTWSKPMAAKFARVLAIEPSPDTCEALTENMRLFDCTNVEIHNVALGAESGRVTMHLDPRAVALQNTGGRYVQDAVNGSVSIPRITLDSLDLRACGFLKLDIEGSEPLALAGARKTLKRCRPIVLFENKNLWLRHGLSVQTPQEVLVRAGYRQLAKAGCDLIWGPA